MSRTIRKLVTFIALVLVLSSLRGSAYASPTGHVLGTVVVGRMPVALAVDRFLHRAYVVNSGDNTVSVLDSRNGDLVRTVSLGREPAKLILGYQIAVDEGIGRVYVVVQREPSQPSRILLLDALSGKVLQVTFAGRFSGKPGINSQVHRVFVPNLDSNTVSVLDGRSGAVLRTVRVGMGPSEVAVAQAAGHAFVGNSDGTISMLDAATGVLLRTIRTGQGAHGFSLIAAGPFGRVFAFNQNGRMTVVDAASGRLLRTVVLGPYLGDAVVDTQSGRMYVPNFGPNGSGTSVNILDARSGNRLRTVTVGRGPVGVAVDAQAGRVFVANEGSSSITTLDGRTGAVLRTTPVQSPVAIGIDDGAHRLFTVAIGSPFGKGHVTIMDSRA